ncbi:MAG: prolyl oligopeptidase family serine peptidase [Polyangiaceae bacterium]
MARTNPYPATRRVEQKDVLFGTEVRDPYRWLEDASAPEVQAWMKAQDDFTRAKLAALPERSAIAARLRELIYVDARGTPISRGDRLFFMSRSAKQEKAVLYVREKATGRERALLDPNTWSSDGSASLLGFSPSWDGRLVAYNRSENNSDEATMHLFDIDGGKDSAVDVIPGTKYGIASWTPAGDGFYYVRLPVDPSVATDARPGYAEICFHKLGTDPATDEIVREKTGDPTKFVTGWVSKDGRWLFSEIAHGWSSNDLYFRDLESGGEGSGRRWTVLAEGKDSHYSVTAFRGRFYVATNEGAPKWRVFSVDPAVPERAAWKEIVPERADATLAGVKVIGGLLALTYMKDVTSRLELHDLDGKLVREVALPAIGTADFAGEPDEDEAYYTFETFNYPYEAHSYSVRDGTDSIWFKLDVPVDPTAYTVEQVFFHSTDGTRIPMFVVRGKSTPRDGRAPAILTGYGGFNASETPGFLKSIFPWLERGGIYAVANLRGGGEYGEAWHRAGMRHEKHHVFEDFEAAAEALVKEKFTSSERLVIRGGSNGGLLVGAALVRRPELFRAVLCAVPLLDMVRYHLFGSGRTWSEEYGAADNEDDFRTLHAYSPYHHVTPGTAYPSVLFDSADSDDRVDPLHARKMAAALQAASTGGPVLLRIERNAGHGGADMQQAWVERYADAYAFALDSVRSREPDR